MHGFCAGSLALANVKLVLVNRGMLEQKQELLLSEKIKVVMFLPGGQEEALLSFSTMLSSNSFLTLSFASLNSRTPLPRPRISSGIFLPPNNNNTTKAINIISVAPRFPIV